MGKRKAGEERKQADFNEDACCPSAVVQGAAQRKNSLCEGSGWGNCDPRKDRQPFRLNPNGVGDRTTTLRRILIGAVQFCSLYMYILYIRLKLHTSLSKKIGVNTRLGTDRKSEMMIRVKVKSKSELVEDREGKSALYGVICCCDDRLLSRAVICDHTV